MAMDVRGGWGGVRHGQDPSGDQLCSLGKPSVGTAGSAPRLVEARVGREDVNWSMIIAMFRETPGVVQDPSLTLINLEMLNKIKLAMEWRQGCWESASTQSGLGSPRCMRGPPSMQGAAWLLRPQDRRETERQRDSEREGGREKP